MSPHFTPFTPQIKRAMPYSRVVEQRYRLQPADLNGPVLVTIANVTLQGLEQIHPVLHFDRVKKRLVLNDVQSDDLARITQSAIFADWVGHEVMLKPINDAEGTQIALSPPHVQPTRSPRASSNQPSQAKKFNALIRLIRPTWQALLLLAIVILLILLLFAAVYALGHTEVLWQYWDDVLFPQRSP